MNFYLALFVEVFVFMIAMREIQFQLDWMPSTQLIDTALFGEMDSF